MRALPVSRRTLFLINGNLEKLRACICMFANAARHAAAARKAKGP
jgi:hypothetical protein